MKALLVGKGSMYLKRVSSSFDRADFAFGGLMGWLIFFASLGGRIFAVPVAKELLRNVQN